MRELALLARYNAHVDRVVYDLLAGVDPELVAKPAGSPFGSILGILNHVLLAELSWLLRFRESLPGSQALAHETVAIGRTKDRMLHQSLTDLCDHHLTVDRLIVDLVGEPGAVDAVAEYTTRAGDRHRHRLGDLLLHVLNHATHHRGQISQILDAAGVEHDYSNLHPLIEQLDG